MQIKLMGPLTQGGHGWGSDEGEPQKPSTPPPLPWALSLHWSQRALVASLDWPPATTPSRLRTQFLSELPTLMSRASLAVTPHALQGAHLGSFVSSKGPQWRGCSLSLHYLGPVPRTVPDTSQKRGKYVSEEWRNAPSEMMMRYFRSLHFVLRSVLLSFLWLVLPPIILWILLTWFSLLQVFSFCFGRWVLQLAFNILILKPEQSHLCSWFFPMTYIVKEMIRMWHFLPVPGLPYEPPCVPLPPKPPHQSHSFP